MLRWIEESLDLAVDELEELLEACPRLRIIADRAVSRVEGRGVLLGGAGITSLQVAVVGVRVRANRQVLDHTRALRLHCKQQTLVVDREIDST